MVRLLIRAVIGVVVLAGIAAAGAYLYVNQLAKAGIERGGTYALGVATTIDSVSIDLRAGRLEIAGLEVANPPGFQDPYFFRVGSGAFHMPLANLSEHTVHVELLALDGVGLNIDRAKTSSNYGVILENLKKLESSGEAADENGGKDFIVEQLRITAVTANLRQEVVAGHKVAVKVEVPEILLKDVGSQSGGVSMAELSGIITKAVLEAVAKSGGVPSQLLGDLTTNLEGLASLSIRLPQGVGSAAELSKQLGGETGKELGKALEGLGGLFGGNKPGSDTR